VLDCARLLLSALASSSGGTAAHGLTPSVVTSLRVGLGLLGYLAYLNLYIMFVNTELQADARSALFGWPSIAIFGVLGAIGIVLADRTGFPSAWDSSIALRERHATC